MWAKIDKSTDSWFVASTQSFWALVELGCCTCCMSFFLSLPVDFCFIATIWRSRALPNLLVARYMYIYISFSLLGLGFHHRHHQRVSGLGIYSKFEGCRAAEFLISRFLPNWFCVQGDWGHDSSWKRLLLRICFCINSVSSSRIEPHFCLSVHRVLIADPQPKSQKEFATAFLGFPS